MKRKQIRELVGLMVWGRVTRRTEQKWAMALADALSETDGDAAFESLRRRFSRKYGRRLGGCTERLVAA